MYKIILRMDDILTLTGYKSRTTIWRKLCDGTFPCPLDLGGRQIGWLREDITNWIDKRPKRSYSENGEKKNEG